MDELYNMSTVKADGRTNCNTFTAVRRVDCQSFCKDRLSHCDSVRKGHVLIKIHGRVLDFPGTYF